MQKSLATLLDGDAPSSQLFRKNLDATILALLYALFVVFFPWEWIQRAEFSDFQNYVDDFNYFSSEGISRLDLTQPTSFVQYLVSESLWHELARWLTSVTGEAAIALRILSFIILFIWGLFLFRRVRVGIALLFLLNPTVIDVAMSGIRNGLAWALVMVALNVRSRVLQLALFATGVFIHSSTLALLAIYYFTQFAARVLKGRVLLASGIGAGVFIGLALTVGSQLVLGAVGDRRSGEEYIVGGGSLLQASIWAILLFLQSASSHEYIRRNIFVMTVFAWYLTMNPFIPWSFRLWACLLPVIAVSAMRLSEQKRRAFIYLYSGYLVLQYLYWTKLFDYWHPA